MTDPVELTDNERRVLAVLDSVEQDYYLPFGPITAKDGCLNLSQVRDACRSLRRKGLADFSNALWGEDGRMLGSGYGLLPAGRKLLADARQLAQGEPP